MSAVQFMLFLSNYSLWTFNYLTSIKSQHYI